MELNKGSALLLIKKAIVWLTFRRLFVSFATSLAIITSYTMYENRVTLTDVLGDDNAAPPREKQVVLGPRLVAYLDEVVNSPKIAGAMVYMTNIKVNEKRVLYSHFDIPAATQVWDETKKLRGDHTLVFDPSDQSNNVQMVAVVNGEFVCSKYNETEYFRIAPELLRMTPTVCRISIPAFYGNFSGVIAFFLTTPLEQLTESEIRLDAVRASNEVYRELVVNRAVVDRQ